MDSEPAAPLRARARAACVAPAVGWVAKCARWQRYARRVPTDVEGAVPPREPTSAPVLTSADTTPDEAALEAELARQALRGDRLARALVAATLALLAAMASAIFHDELNTGVRQVRLHVAGWLGDEPAAGVDLETVHAELWPRWVLANSRALAAGPDLAAWCQDRNGGGASCRRWEAEKTAYQALRQAVGDDAVLGGVLDELRGLVRDPRRLEERPGAMHALIREWNRYLGATGWWLEGRMRHRPDGSTEFYVKAYRVRAQLEARAGQRPVPVQLLTRADPLNVVETVLGHASPDQDAAVVLVDRVHDMALQVVWPLLDPALDPVQPLPDRLFAAAIRREAARNLPADDLAVLRQTAAHRHRLEGVREAVLKRRSCGSRFTMGDLPWSGLPARSFGSLRSYVDDDQDCPALTAEEANQLIDSSRILAATGRLQPAIERLVAWLARGVAVHEARHVADQLQHRGLEIRLPCQECGPDLGTHGRAELSAYLSELAQPGLAAVSLLQVCRLMDSTSGGTRKALERLVAGLGPDACRSTPPADLAWRAQVLEQTVFGQRDTVQLPANFPERLAVPERTAR